VLSEQLRRVAQRDDLDVARAEDDGGAPGVPLCVVHAQPEGGGGGGCLLTSFPMATDVGTRAVGMVTYVWCRPVAAADDAPLTVLAGLVGARPDACTPGTHLALLPPWSGAFS
jgi:hypothetical protein